MKYRQKCVLMMQKYIRGFLARKQHQPRIRGIIKINGISANVKKMEEIANELKSEKDPMLKQIREFEEQIRMAAMKIKVIKNFKKHSFMDFMTHYLKLFRQIRRLNPTKLIHFMKHCYRR